jgi:23S rRNA pseudouridine2605 synthase
MAKKTSKTPKNDDLQPVSTEPEIAATPETEATVEAEAEVETAAIEEPEAEVAEEAPEADVEPAAEEEVEAEEAETEADAVPEPEDRPEPEDESEGEFTSKPRPPAKLERLQKILAAAGVASRRSAEGMIEQGRVQVNGKVVTELGTKADAGRDHIRVDGKLLQGPERLRYFVLNKPKGFVTTVKDPEGRPTVMQFFDKFKERLYPVGRLDYMSEGLLVVTNDGDLANRLTRASSGVEKTYLVKVAGQPTEDELDILRGGVAIERGKPGSGQVRTSPARIRQVRQGDNPWYEVVLIEGRNRELRKMFEEIGHFVEKIRRIGYGPLVLDQEPGNLRELEPEELERLRQAAEGKLRTPKSKELRRRNAMDAAGLPTVAPRPTLHPRPAKPFEQDSAATPRTGEFRPRKSYGADRPSRGAGTFGKSADKPFRPARPATEGFTPAAGQTADRRPARTDDRPRRATGAGPAKFGSARPTGRQAWKKDDRPTRPPSRFAAGPTGESRPAPAERTTYDRPRTESSRQGSTGTGRTGAGRPFTAKPTWKKSDRPIRTARPEFKRPPAPPRREARDFDEDLGPVRPPNLHIEEITAPDRSSTTRPSAPRSSYSRPGAPRPYSDRPRPSRPGFEGPGSSARSSAAKPFRGESGLARPFTTSSGKPRAGGARPSSKPGAPAGRSSSQGWKPGKPAGRSYSGPAKRSFRREEGEGSFAPRPPRPYTPRTESASDYRPTKAKPYPNSTSRAERKAGPGWKPKTAFGAGKPSGSARSKPKPGGFSKSGYKGKPTGSGPKRTGSRPAGKRPGGAHGGKKRG